MEYAQRNINTIMRLMKILAYQERLGLFRQDMSKYSQAKGTYKNKIQEQHQFGTPTDHYDLEIKKKLLPQVYYFIISKCNTAILFPPTTLDA